MDKCAPFGVQPHLPYHQSESQLSGRLISIGARHPLPFLEKFLAELENDEDLHSVLDPVLIDNSEESGKYCESAGRNGRSFPFFQVQPVDDQPPSDGLGTVFNPGRIAYFSANRA